MNTETITRAAKRYAPHIKVKKLETKMLVNAAINDFLKRNPDAPTTTIGAAGAPGLVLTFIRHKLTNYDELMDKTRTDKERGYDMRNALRLAVLFATEREYGNIPWIKKEIAKRIAHQNEMLN